MFGIHLHHDEEQNDNLNHIPHLYHDQHDMLEAIKKLNFNKYEHLIMSTLVARSQDIVVVDTDRKKNDTYVHIIRTFWDINLPIRILFRITRQEIKNADIDAIRNELYACELCVIITTELINQDIIDKAREHNEVPVALVDGKFLGKTLMDDKFADLFHNCWDKSEDAYQ